jgi:steroid delta-isomerase-like uncharacterized protein
MDSQNRNISIACIILIALGSIFQTATADTEANKALMRRVLEEAYNQGNLDVIDEAMAADYTWPMDNPQVRSSEEFKQHVAELRTNFPDIHTIVEDQIAEGDKVVTRWTIVLTPQVTMTGILISIIADGKIAGDWENYDELGLMQQFGAIPPTRETYTWGDPSSATGDPGDPETNKACVQRMIDEVMNKQNMAVIDELFSADYIMHDPAWPMEVKGPEGFKQWAGAMLEPFFSNSEIAIGDIITEGDKVVVRWSWSGTHTGEFMGIPPTGRQISITGTSIHRFADGKFVESWASYDSMGMMQQLTTPEWPLAGAWVERIPPWENVVDPGIALHKLTPLDSEGNRLLYTVKFVNEVASLPGLPPIDYVSQFIGEAVKTGLNTYEYTVVCYAAVQQDEPGQRRGQVTVIAMITGRAELLDHDHRYDTQMYMWFTADQDVDPADGFPDEGQEPVLTLGPFAGDAFTRVPLVPLPEGP